MDWNAIQQYLPLYQKAAVLTVRLGVAGIIFAIIIGLACAVIQYDKVPVLRQIVGVYIQLSRNTPLLVQLFFIYSACTPKPSNVCSCWWCSTLSFCCRCPLWAA